MSVATAEDLFVAELKDIYSAEKQAVRAFPGIELGQSEDEEEDEEDEELEDDDLEDETDQTDDEDDLEEDDVEGSPIGKAV